MSAAAQMETGHEFSFKAFLSYSHAADGKLAPALQSALHRFAKPWHQLRALRVFRDKTSLSANPALWPSIVEALSASEYFLLLASPAAAASQWVQAEVKWWVENRSTEQLLILLTDGDLVWDAANRDFDWHATVSLPSSLRGRFRDEPLWVDFRWAKSGESLSLRHVQFRAAVLDLAAPLHGRPKDLLDGESPAAPASATAIVDHQHRTADSPRGFDSSRASRDQRSVDRRPAKAGGTKTEDCRGRAPGGSRT